eukprot:CAMPEP_0119036484 /NCGR_PEP_ID=MMETSP1177-20130426/4212_1 /TAXON_ID=2985 /ORGANISM="Ochromonas sp, Strain CCMP1899" /LENGTH=481 /DNA_ID=CAMNT_0006996413 /DNA_START=450 /DNA_END=1895 /DNA_ORIENTATION=-
MKYPDCSISGTCRSKDKSENLMKFGIQPHIFNPDENDSGLDAEGRSALKNASHIVTLIPPVADFDKDPVLNYHLRDILTNRHSSRLTSGKSVEIETLGTEYEDIYEDDSDGSYERDMQNERDEMSQYNVNQKEAGLWIGYVSTTGVYGDHKGGWVTEKSLALAPLTSKAYSRLAVEDTWLGLRNVNQRSLEVNDSNKAGIDAVGDMSIDEDSIDFKDNGDESIEGKIYSHVFRLGGIYGPGRSAIETVKNKRVERRNQDSSPSDGVKVRDTQASESTTNWVSRIHVSDICGAILASMVDPAMRLEDAVYNVADDQPAPRSEVMAYAERLLDEGVDTKMDRNGMISANGVSSEKVITSDIDIGSLTSRYESPLTSAGGGGGKEQLTSSSPSESTAERESSTSISNLSTPASVKADNINDKTNSDKVTKDNSVAENSERTRRRISENKRVSNKHLKEALKYEFKYPTYKEGLEGLLRGSTDPF